ncbi:unnamed protein product [Plutella xylostella]|uniref:(diamondback moth) hypothetical protein n=1 Tax=Plutella xylostella TaxID=51655 RepID=A0A8S4FQD1_PLUXY|nr:unnamed protein product [Plutella xylostella]
MAFCFIEPPYTGFSHYYSCELNCAPGQQEPGVTPVISTQRPSRRPRQQKEKPQSLQDVFNTTSCIPPPYRCPHHKLQFYLYTRSTQEKGELLDTLDNLSLTRSRFNPAHPTKIVVHGFGGGRNLSPSTDMRKAYFARGNYNIIIADYGSLVKEPCLNRMGAPLRRHVHSSAGRVHPVPPSKRVAPEQIHTIGYSVGAHILGLVANHLAEGNLAGSQNMYKPRPDNIFYMGNNRPATWTTRMPYSWISCTRARHIGPMGLMDTLTSMSMAVEPARRAHDTIFLRELDHTDALVMDILHTGAGSSASGGRMGMPTSTTVSDLDHTDALFVDILHHGRGILGQWGPNGHADFYVNGGSSQPGCAHDTIFREY